MSRTLTLLTALLALLPLKGWAQTAEAPKWDVTLSAGLFDGRPGENNIAYQDNWYFQARYGVALGHYWTEHLKTEVDYARSGEGSVYVQDFKTVDGQIVPFGFQSFHRLDQLSARLVWQFGHNAWVHPWLSGGVVADRDRQRLHIPAQYQFVNGRATLVTADTDTSPTVDYRLGVTAAAGAKIYVSRNAFFNTGVIATWSRPSATVSFLSGFGFDF